MTRYNVLLNEAKMAVIENYIHFIVLVYSGHGNFKSSDNQSFGITERNNDDEFNE